MPRNALLVEITPEDLSFAVQKNRYNCAIVRAIERKLPDALRVVADAKHIAFTLPDDKLKGSSDRGVRYSCKIEEQSHGETISAIIEAFDKTGDVPEELRTFTLQAIEAKPMSHGRRQGQRVVRERQQERDRQRRKASTNPRVSSYNRWLDADAEGV